MRFARNQYIVNHTFLKGLNEILFILSKILNVICDNFDTGDAHTNCLNNGDFVKSGTVKFVRYLRGQMCLCPD
jgi:UTP-glucose-1-phosphate uridylyltransferase